MDDKKPDFSKIVTKRRSEISYNGYIKDQLISGIQKYIRRQNCNKAVYCAGELDIFKFANDTGGKSVRTNMLHRLMIIFLEDIGVGGINLWSIVDQRVMFLLTTRSKPLASRNMKTEADSVAEVVILMCRSQKSRMCSYLRAICKENDVADLIAQRYYPDVYRLRQEFKEQLKITKDQSGTTTKITPDLLHKKLQESLIKRSWLAVWWAFEIIPKWQGKKAPDSSTSLAILKTIEITVKSHFSHLISLVRLAFTWYNELKTNAESFLCWLLLINAIVQIDHITPVKEDLDIPSVNEWSKNLKEYKIDLESDQYVIDMHTAAGKRKGKNALDFATQGAVVYPESGCVISTFKQFYIDMKRHDQGGMALVVAAHSQDQTITLDQGDLDLDTLIPPDQQHKSIKCSTILRQFQDFISLPASKPQKTTSIDYKQTEIHDMCSSIFSQFEDFTILPKSDSQKTTSIQKETEAYKIWVRAQANTSAHKPDVYFATDSQTGQFVVVKGPFDKLDKGINNAIEIAQWKKENGIPYVMPQVRKLVPDLWPRIEGQPKRVPLGIRNKFNEESPAYFMITPSIFPKKNIKPKKYSGTSTLWDGHLVADIKDNGFHVDANNLQKLTKQQIKDYITALIVRWIFGISDTASRNFIIDDNHVISVDEEYRDKFDAISNELKTKTKQKQPVLFWINNDNNYQTLGIQKWKVSDKYKDRLKVISNKEGAVSIFKPA